MLISFLFHNKNICCGYSLEAPRHGTSNEYPQHMYSLRNKKNVMWIPPLICSYDIATFAIATLTVMKFHGSCLHEQKQDLNGDLELSPTFHKGHQIRPQQFVARVAVATFTVQKVHRTCLYVQKQDLNGDLKLAPTFHKGHQSWP